MTTIVLVHGWGHDASLWDAVRARLDAEHSIETLDLGFFGAVPPAPTFPEPVIAVGHSLGALWWLTQRDISWSRLLCINGFPRFTATDAYPGVAPRVLARMRSQLAKEPATVLTDFHARCGVTGPQTIPDAARLDVGLVWLADWDGRTALSARRDDIFALAGTDDAIVPRAMSETAFAALPAGHLEFTDVPGHVLPLAAPEMCARWIEAHSA